MSASAPDSQPAWLTTALHNQPSAFSFVAAIDAVAGGVALGGTSAAAERVRLRPHLGLAFPLAEVVAAEKPCDPGSDLRWQITVGLPGLYGANSPLPTSYTEDLLARDVNDPTRGLLDVIHHRLLSLLHRALHKYRDGDLAGPLQRLTGLHQRLIGGRIPSQRLLAYTGILAGRARGADTLERVLSHFHEVPCRIEQCIEMWTPLPADQLTRLGEANCGLGSDCVAGDTICSRATAFRITVGPLRWSDMAGFLPGGERLADLQALVGHLEGDALDYEVELLIDTTGLPESSLGDARLGLDLRTSGAFPTERREIVYRSTGH